MTEAEVISRFASDLGMSTKAVRRLFAELRNIAFSEVKKTGVFVVPGLGRLVKTERKARLGRNPQTGEPIKIRAKFVIKFRVASSVKDFVAGPPRRAKREPNSAVVRIFYATDREAASTGSFGSRRNPSGELQFGTCDISIPRDHRMGHLERPMVRHLEFRENPEKHFVILETTHQTPESFYTQLAERVATSKKEDLFVFIHGFKVSFSDAAYRTAQIAYDLGFEGAPVLYSWPSNGKLYKYTADTNNSDWTVSHLRLFLSELATRSGAKVVHLIAHSMGNRALTNALNTLVAQGAQEKPTHFNQVVLTAPDIDADIFKQLADAIKKTADRITLYASRNDRALAASKKLNGSYPRAGDCSRTVVVVPGIDTVDASAVDTNLIGHFYYAENRSVLTDVFSLFKDGSPPNQRFGIRPAEEPPPHWKFTP